MQPSPSEVSSQEGEHGPMTADLRQARTWWVELAGRGCAQCPEERGGRSVSPWEEWSHIHSRWAG